jgi:AGZA family xanthine/uracil permease-like MFS transporter
VVIAVLCFLGMFGFLGSIFPLPAIVPILLYIGLLIGAQAFQFTPKAHAAAVIAALVPNIASWATGQIDNALAAANTNASAVGEAALENSGVVYHGLQVLGQGAILAGLVLGAIVAFIIDKRFVHAAIFAGAGAALSFVGLIHGEKVEWNANGQVALGYVFVAVICGIFAATRPEPRVPEADEIELDRLHGGGSTFSPESPAGVEQAPVTIGSLPADAEHDGVPEPRHSPDEEPVVAAAAASDGAEPTPANPRA